MAVYPFSPSNAADPALDAVAVELEAMQAVARAMAGVRDPKIRQRVLQWANERFNIGPASRPPTRPAETADITAENGLEVEPLYDLFELRHAAIQPRFAQSAGAPNAATAPIVDSLYDFFDHPRAAALPASVEALAPTANPPSAPVAVVRELRAVGATRELPEDAPLDTMVKGFASELQRLAVEWQTA